jgi:lysozyme
MIRRIIDVSHYEDPIDFNKVAADGIVAIIAKATQGASWIDPAYAKFKQAASRVRLPSPVRRSLAEGGTSQLLNSSTFLWGSYHFGTAANVAAQIDHYLATATPEKQELVCLDFEENPTGASMTLNQAREFVSLFQNKTGRYPVLYGGAWLKEQLNGKGDDLLARCPLWIAQYASKPVLPPGWEKYVLWQYTDGQSGSQPREVNGIGACDRSQYGGSVTQLQQVWPFGPQVR